MRGKLTAIQKNPNLLTHLDTFQKLFTVVQPISVLVQGDVHQGWPEISCILSGQAAELGDNMTFRLIHSEAS